MAKSLGIAYVFVLPYRMQPLLPLKPLVLRGATFDPPLFCAPMANLTHSAWRRLLADYGGCGAVYSEMLCARMILQEKADTSPWLKRRPNDGRVVYQLLVSDTFRLEEIVDRIQAFGPDGLDLNCACGAPLILLRGGGMALFDDADRMRDILRIMRSRFPGPLTVKIRLGREKPDWWEQLVLRLRVFEDEGVDAIILHPRFHEDKFKRNARHEIYARVAAQTGLPLIANGDIEGVDYVTARQDLFKPVSGFMIGRLAAAQPWLFRQWHTPGIAVDHAKVVHDFSRYLADDFPPNKALIRLKVWMPYFASNFSFGHVLFKAVQQSSCFEQALERTFGFLATNPERRSSISVSGI